MKEERMSYFIKKYELETAYNPKVKEIGLKPSFRKEKEILKNTKELAEIRENKSEIITFIQNEKKRIENERKQEIERQIKIIENAEIEYFEYEMGCDTADRYYIKYKNDKDIEREAKTKRESKDINAIKEAMLSHHLNNYTEENNVEQIESRMMTYGGYKFNKEQTEYLITEGNKIIKQKEETKEKNRQEKEENKKKIFQIAKETGKPQILQKWMDDCDGTEEDCSFDTIYEYAMPDGSIKIDRLHCY